jgi:capsular exopolysaccharide synthesis family protein
MKDAPFTLDMSNDEPSFNLKELVFKYLKHWPWFLLSLMVCLMLGFLYLRYAPVAYETVAKVKIIDESKELSVGTDALSLLNGATQLNMDNEIEVLKSFRLLSQVAEELNLDVSYFEKGNVKSTQIWNPPFTIKKDIAEDSLLYSKTFQIQLNPNQIKVTDEKEHVWNIGFDKLDTTLTHLPFKLDVSPVLDMNNYLGINYEVVLRSRKATVSDLNGQIGIQTTSKKSDIIALSLRGESFERSEAILNTLIRVFNNDGILDRQQVSRRTLDFIDERFVYLSSELDSIEGGKEDFKRANSLSYIEADAGISLERKSTTEIEVADLETQISLSGLLKKTIIEQAAYSVLPVNIGLENDGLNSLISNYNTLAMERDKLMITVGEEHPTLLAVTEQLERTKVNIFKTVNVYQTQLKTALKRLNREQSKANSVFSRLPEKEKMLRSIERQQSIKENLFLLLLQKREEAAINLAVTAPSVKVVDFGQTKNLPVAPKKMVVLGISGLLGFFIPFAFFFVKSTLDTQVNERADLEKILPTIPIAAEIPHIKDNKVFTNIDDRSVMSESFRILATNLNYLLPKNLTKAGKVVYVTSCVEGEGKSLLAYNLSVALASLNKKVLLVGADLRKPKLHDYFGMGQNTKGLSDFLKNPAKHTTDFIYPGLDKVAHHKVCLSGPIPPNAPLLLSSPGFEQFISAVKTEYDYIIMDTAPTMLVTDTLLISEHADITLLVTRAGHTDKSLLEKFGNSKQSENFKNLALVLNDTKPLLNTAYTYGIKQA